MIRPKLAYRASAALLALFAIGHQIGFRQVDPAWHADAVAAAMKSTRFDVMGFSRTYWDFFSGFGFFSTVFLLFSAVLAFELGGQTTEVLRSLRRVRWAFAACYVVIAILMVTNFFLVPLIFATLIAACLVLGALAR